MVAILVGVGDRLPRAVEKHRLIVAAVFDFDNAHVGIVVARSHRANSADHRRSIVVAVGNVRLRMIVYR